MDLGERNCNATGRLKSRMCRGLSAPNGVVPAFEHEGRLADLLARQRRLQRHLDLDQDSAGASRMDTEDTKLAA